MQSIPQRGLPGIKTQLGIIGITGRINTADGILLKLLHLEREKSRRTKEKISLETRCQQHNERLKDVDKEIKKLRQLVNKWDEKNNLLTQGLSPKDAFCRPTKGFTLRY